MNEELVLEIIVNGGNARSCALEAIRSAREGAYDESEKQMASAADWLLKAHEAQTQMIQDEITGKGGGVTLMAVHAQDHLMNAMTVIDLAKEIIAGYTQDKKGDEE